MRASLTWILGHIDLRILDFLYLQPRKLYVFRNEDGFPLRTLLLVTSHTERVSKLVAMEISCILVHLTGWTRLLLEADVSLNSTSNLIEVLLEVKVKMVPSHGGWLFLYHFILANRRSVQWEIFQRFSGTLTIVHHLL